MKIRPPGKSDWDTFLALSADEGWRVPEIELSLFMGAWAPYAHVLDDDGFCGLITAVPYEKSAWIGNLIVPADFRGRGYGTDLFKFALKDLLKRGVESVWLTASELGLAIYERAGFVVVDSIERWIRPVLKAPETCEVYTEKSNRALLSADRAAWGEDRSRLLSEIGRSAQVFRCGRSVVMLQTGRDSQIIGPWHSCQDSDGSNHGLMRELVSAANPEVELVVDLLSSSSMQPLCRDFGFTCSGRTALMSYGDARHANIKDMISLASLGSVG